MKHLWKVYRQRCTNKNKGSIWRKSWKERKRWFFLIVTTVVWKLILERINILRTKFYCIQYLNKLLTNWYISIDIFLSTIKHVRTKLTNRNHSPLLLMPFKSDAADVIPTRVLRKIHNMTPRRSTKHWRWASFASRMAQRKGPSSLSAATSFKFKRAVTQRNARKSNTILVISFTICLSLFWIIVHV